MFTVPNSSELGCGSVAALFLIRVPPETKESSGIQKVSSTCLCYEWMAGPWPLCLKTKVEGSSFIFYELGV